MTQILTHESLQAQARQGVRQRQALYQFGGEMRAVDFRIDHGRVFADSRFSGEMGALGTLSGLANIEQLTGRMVLDVEIGRERVSLLYGPLYETMNDPNFPATLEAKWALRGVVVFAQVLELEQLKYGHFEAEQGPSVPILTFGAMLPVTRQMVDFNQSWNVTEVSRSFGEAWNALLNHLHFSPILDFNYQAANITAYQAGGENDPAWVGVANTIRKGIADSAVAKRRATILVASEANRDVIEQALAGGTISGTVYKPISVDQVIFYEGWEITWRGQTVTYPGVGGTYGYLIRPKRGLKELVKRDMVLEALGMAGGDATRLIDYSWRGFGYRGVYAAVEQNVQRIELVAQG